MIRESCRELREPHAGVVNHRYGGMGRTLRSLGLIKRRYRLLNRVTKKGDEVNLREYSNILCGSEMPMNNVVRGF